jgi:hypothetical protein
MFPVWYRQDDKETSVFCGDTRRGQNVRYLKKLIAAAKPALRDLQNIFHGLDGEISHGVDRFAPFADFEV